jgi:hypothetical protein
MDTINVRQRNPPSDPALPAADWKKSGRIFGVIMGGKEYYPSYRFDTTYQPLPVIPDILDAMGEVADSWKIAVWFHNANAWVIDTGPDGVTPIAPKDALNRREDLLNAIHKRTGSYVA